VIALKVYKSLYYLTFIEQIESKNTNDVFALYKRDFLISAPSFYVLKFEDKVDSNNSKYKSVFNTEQTQLKFNELMDKVILENYDEDRAKTTNPKIRVIENDFLVMERGGYFFSLYNLKLDKAIYNDCCPFGAWASQNYWAVNGTNYRHTGQEDFKSDYGIWVENNLHQPILNYINVNK